MGSGLARTLASLAATLMAVGGLSLVAPARAVAATNAELAARWAPIHFQDTDSTDYDADYLSPIDYDGDWSGLNNWEHQDDNLSRLAGAVYYSVVSTSTHWFIVYGFYHPRDWCDTFFCASTDSHENDMEGALLTVRRDGTTYGRLEAMVTVFHSNFFSFKPSDSPYTNGRENIDGTVITQSYNGAPHPTTFQEAKGHGCKAGEPSAVTTGRTTRPTRHGAGMIRTTARTFNVDCWPPIRRSSCTHTSATRARSA